MAMFLIALEQIIPKLTYKDWFYCTKQPFESSECITPSWTAQMNTNINSHEHVEFVNVLVQVHQHKFPAYHIESNDKNVHKESHQ